MLANYIWRGANPDNAINFRYFASRSFQKVIPWFKSTASLNKIELIVRPRPAIPMQKFIAGMNKVVGHLPKNIHLIPLNVYLDYDPH